VNLFVVAVTSLQAFAAIYEWGHGRFYTGTFWFGLTISNWAILEGAFK